MAREAMGLAADQVCVHEVRRLLTFRQQAEVYVERVHGRKVVVSGGEPLAEPMIEHGVGVATAPFYEQKEVSNNFFDEDGGDSWATNDWGRYRPRRSGRLWSPR
jgi:hypothetical protein